MLIKIVATALCSILMQNIQIFYQGSVMFIVTCYQQIVCLFSHALEQYLFFVFPNIWENSGSNTVFKYYWQGSMIAESHILTHKSYQVLE